MATESSSKVSSLSLALRSIGNYFCLQIGNWAAIPSSSIAQCKAAIFFFPLVIQQMITFRITRLIQCSNLIRWSSTQFIPEIWLSALMYSLRYPFLRINAFLVANVMSPKSSHTPLDFRYHIHLTSSSSTIPLFIINTTFTTYNTDTPSQ
jgi:hypothetical protein